MNIGMIGLGKLGLPCAMAMESKGHEVLGYDPSPKVQEILDTRKLPYMEEGAQELLDKTHIKIVGIDKIVSFADIIFVAVQTPHDDKFGGITRIPNERKDFDYTMLKKAVKDLSDEIDQQKKHTIVVVISTVLPGTMDREIKPLLSPFVKFCYNPYFIAMSTTIRDFTDPEFVLFGVDDKDALEKAQEFYRTINPIAPFFECNIKEAEFLKIAYNTYISTKISYINGLGELAHKMGGINMDKISEGLSLGLRRLMSHQYLNVGMSDGGSCHPRDNIALSKIFKDYNVSFDFPETMMMAREKQTEWLAKLVVEEHSKTHLPIVIFGKAYKPETNLPQGSPSILLHNILHEFGLKPEFYDPFMDGELPEKYTEEPHIFFIGTKHKEFADYIYPIGSTIIDPHRYIPENETRYKLVSIGKNLYKTEKKKIDYTVL